MYYLSQYKVQCNSMQHICPRRKHIAPSRDLVASRLLLSLPATWGIKAPRWGVSVGVSARRGDNGVGGSFLKVSATTLPKFTTRKSLRDIAQYLNFLLMGIYRIDPPDMPYSKVPLSAGWSFKQDEWSSNEWLPVEQVPTQIHMDLLAHQK